MEKLKGQFQRQIPKWFCFSSCTQTTWSPAYYKCPSLFIETSGLFLMFYSLHIPEHMCLFVCLAKARVLGFSSDARDGKTLKENKKHYSKNECNKNPRFLKPLMCLIWTGAVFTFQTLTLSFTSSFRFFWRSVQRAKAEGAPLGMRGGWFPSSLSTPLPKALSPAPLTEFLINDEMWYK